MLSTTNMLLEHAAKLIGHLSNGVTHSPYPFTPTFEAPGLWPLGSIPFDPFCGRTLCDPYRTLATVDARTLQAASLPATSLPAATLATADARALAAASLASRYPCQPPALPAASLASR